MKIRHDLVAFEGEIIPYIYVELNYDYEFGKDFFSKDSENSFTYKLKKYVDQFLSNSKNGKAVLIVNGIMVGTMSLALFLGLYNKNVSNDTCEILGSSEETSVVATDTDKDLEILKKGSISSVIEENVNNKKEEIKNNENITQSTTKNEEKNVNISNASTNSVKVNSNVQNINKEESNIKDSQNVAPVKPEIKEEIKVVGKEEVPKENESPVANTEVSKPEASKPEVSQPEVNEPEAPKEEEPVYTGVMVTLNNRGVITNLKLEDYIVGVVSAEMPASFSTEALKAQAVAARTYTMKKVSQGRTLVNSTSDQVYKTESELRATWGGSFDFYYNKVKEAVNSTKRYGYDIWRTVY